MPGLIPSSVTDLDITVYDSDHLEIGSIPSSVTDLDFGNIFDKSLLDGVIPKSAIRLKFGGSYSHRTQMNIFPARFEVFVLWIEYMRRF